jgi:hypothetical protein
MFKKYLCVAALISHPFLVMAHELGAHVHGIASLQIAVDEKTLTLGFSSPLDNLLGFEHVARDAKQKSAVKKMADNFNRADQFFIPTAEAQCVLQSVKLDSLVLNSRPAENDAHADIDGEFVFACKQIGKLHDLEVKLFDAYPNVHQLNIEIATLKKQSSVKLTNAARRVSW